MKNNYINTSKNSSSEVDHSPEKKIVQCMGNIGEKPSRAKKISRVGVLDVIREKGEISKYALAKEIGCDYKTIHYIIRDFEFAGVVKINMVLRNSKAVALVSIPVDEVER